MATKMASNRFKKQNRNPQDPNSNKRSNQQQSDNSLDAWKEMFNENNTSQLNKKSSSNKSPPKKQQQQQNSNMSPISNKNQSKQQKGTALKKGGEMIMNQGYNPQGVNIQPPYKQNNPKTNPNMKGGSYPTQGTQKNQMLQQPAMMNPNLQYQMMMNQNQQQQMMMHPNQYQNINPSQNQQYKNLQGYPSPNLMQQKGRSAISPKQRMNQKNDMMMNYQNKMNPNEMRMPRANSSGPHSNIRDFVEYNPYTLNDYRQLTRVAVVLGPLGANLGTKEWEDKKNKMKKMEMYSNKVSQTHLGLKSIKKDTPQDEIDKSLKRKMEESIRYKSKEYSKLIHPKKVNNGIMDYYYKDLGIINEEEERKVNTLMESHANNATNSKSMIDQNKSSIINQRDGSDNSLNYNIDMSKDSLAIHNSLPINQLGDKQEKGSIASLLQQQESYKAKINDIKESLLD